MIEKVKRYLLTFVLGIPPGIVSAVVASKLTQTSSQGGVTFMLFLKGCVPFFIFFMVAITPCGIVLRWLTERERKRTKERLEKDNKLTVKEEVRKGVAKAWKESEDVVLKIDFLDLIKELQSLLVYDDISLCNLFISAQGSVLKDQADMVSKVFTPNAKRLNESCEELREEISKPKTPELSDIKRLSRIWKSIEELKFSFYEEQPEIKQWKEELKNQVELEYDRILVKLVRPFVKKAKKHLSETFVPIPEDLP